MIRYAALFALCFVVACGGGGGSVPSNIEATKRSAVNGPGGCGVRDAWVVREVSGVRLSQPAMLSTATVRALDTWVRRVAIPAVGRRGGGLSELRVAAHYACRNINSRRGGKLSEHAKGNAIDISALVMRDGSRVTVLNGWNSGRDRALLQRLHRVACGTFGTVLGPNADRFHRDHFHFDVASRRRAYCR